MLPIFEAVFWLDRTDRLWAFSRRCQTLSFKKGNKNRWGKFRMFCGATAFCHQSNYQNRQFSHANRSPHIILPATVISLPRNPFSIIRCLTKRFRDDSTPDSWSPISKTPSWSICCELGFHWLSADVQDFKQNGLRIRIPETWLPYLYQFPSVNLDYYDDLEMLLADWLDR